LARDLLISKDRHRNRRASGTGRRRRSDAICCGAYGSFWHIASFRGDAAIQSLSARSGHSASRA